MLILHWNPEVISGFPFKSPAMAIPFFRLLNLLIGVLLISPLGAQPLNLGNKREIFVDYYLLDKLSNVNLVLQKPIDEGIAFHFDKPWETLSPAYITVINDNGLYRAYYRAGRKGADLKAYTNEEWTCYAESKDGVTWIKPNLGLFEFEGSKANNIVLAGEAPAHHNFSPFIDQNPNAPASQRYKALGGTTRDSVGLVPYYSADGIHWKKLTTKRGIYKGAFDSQNVAFWSESEKQYICYFRTFKTIDGKRIRTISRSTSPDFVNWTEPVEMSYGNTPPEHLYIQQTSPYFRAPHIYVAIGARLLPDQQIGTDEQYARLGVAKSQYKGSSEPFFMTTRGGSVYDRTFMESFIKPGIGLNNWSARTNYPALNVVQTGETEMSLYVNQDYTQPTSHLRRYSMRLDGFTSLTAPYAGGTATTRTFTFQGNELEINYATAAAGVIRIEIQDQNGKPIPGYTLNDADPIIGNEIRRSVTWKGKSDVGSLSGKQIKLHITMKDADLYSLKFN